MTIVRPRRWWTVACAAFALVGLPAGGQNPEGMPTGSLQGEAFDAAAEEPAPPTANIDDMLAQDEDVLYGDQATYDPGARRDPFRSLLVREQADQIETVRPEGVPGLLIDEIELQGIFMTEDGPIAQIQAASNEASYLLRPGDQLWDGDVVGVGLDGITFKQSIDDPTALKPFREVVKKLNP